MWSWDQGHLDYFQFERIREIARVGLTRDFKKVDRETLLKETGLQFKAPSTHSPWRNYARVLKICLLVSEDNGVAVPTPISKILSQPGNITCDEYFHFLARSFTSPSPAFKDWYNSSNIRYPFLFSLKYALCKIIIGTSADSSCSLDEIIGAYMETGFKGNEDFEEFSKIVKSNSNYENAAKSSQDDKRRQARESLKVISQISYLHCTTKRINVSLDERDAQKMFDYLLPIHGVHSNNPDATIRKISNLFEDSDNFDSFNYASSALSDITESGFKEGSKIRRAHLTIERNKKLREMFFKKNPITVCDMCVLDTEKTYNWTKRVLELHHILPLSSGTRVTSHGTTLDDLVPLCPTCHRAVHRYYEIWLGKRDRRDFKDLSESRCVYETIKTNFPGSIHAT